MSIADRLPEMSLAQLTQLEANATRLAAGAPGKQRDQAAALLPLLEAELNERREAKKKATPVREKKPRAPRKTKTPLTESEKADAVVADIDEALGR